MLPFPRHGERRRRIRQDLAFRKRREIPGVEPPSPAGGTNAMIMRLLDETSRTERERDGSSSTGLSRGGFRDVASYRGSALEIARLPGGGSRAPYDTL